LVVRSLDEAWSHDSEGEGGEREVQRRKAKGRDTEQETDGAGEQAGYRDRHQVVDVVAGDENGGGVGAKGHEGSMAERDLPAVPDKDVEAHDRDREDEHLGPLAALKAGDERGKPYQQ
jgi:hypothetical protein